MDQDARVWVASDPKRYFLLSDAGALPAGSLLLKSGVDELRVEPDAVRAYELSEDQAHRWTRSALGTSLTDLRASLDDTLAGWRARLDASLDEPVAPDTTVTPSAVPALLDFLRALPGIVGQSISGDDARLDTARKTLSDLQRQLAEGGIELDDRFTGYADRLAALRRDATARHDAPPAPGAAHDRDDDPPPAADGPSSPDASP